MIETIKAPFPWFGGKSRAAAIIWERFGDVPNYVEPFAGSLAVLLARPHKPANEIVNDLDCYVANAWRAVQDAPDAVAAYCDWPVNEADLHARHRWLHGRAEFRNRMEHDPDYYDARIAGYWIWGLSCWIGDNFCRPKKQAGTPHLTGGQGVARKVPHLMGGKGDRGVNAKTVRQIPRLTAKQGIQVIDSPSAPPNEGEGGIHRKRPSITHGNGVNVELKRPSLAPWKGMDQAENLIDWFSRLAVRLRFTKVCCGDWSRVCTKAATWGQGLTGVLLDPPYDPKAGLDTVYGDLHCDKVSAAVREWAIENGSNPLLRIALCGYEGEHAMPSDWECVEWKAAGGYGGQRKDKTNVNAARERIWFSPACLKAEFFGMQMESA